MSTIKVKKKPANKIRKALIDILSDSIDSLNLEIELKKKLKSKSAA